MLDPNDKPQRTDNLSITTVARAAAVRAAALSRCARSSDTRAPRALDASSSDGSRS